MANSLFDTGKNVSQHIQAIVKELQEYITEERRMSVSHNPPEEEVAIVINVSENAVLVTFEGSANVPSRGYYHGTESKSFVGAMINLRVKIDLGIIGLSEFETLCYPRQTEKSKGFFRRIFESLSSWSI